MTLDKDKLILSSLERVCTECGRKFIAGGEWAYRLVVKGHTIWFCRYNCVRAGEKKLKAERAGRKTDLNPNKPKKEVLEKDLRSGLPILNIAKKYGASVASIHNWIKAYGLAGIQGQKKPKDEISEPTQTSGRSRVPMTSGVGVAFEGNLVTMDAPPADDMVQTSPSLTELEQVHPNVEIQEFSHVEPTPWVNAAKVENLLTTTESTETPPDNISPITDSVPDPKPLEFEEVWNDLRDDLAALRRLYVSQAEKSFNERLHGLFLEVRG